jgi:hypothetical protein
MTAKNKGNERERVKNDFLQKMNLQKITKKLKRTFFQMLLSKEKVKREI